MAKLDAAQLDALLEKMRTAYAAGDLEEAMAWARLAAPHVHKRPAPIVLAKIRKRA
jgi:hypothetical protein